MLSLLIFCVSKDGNNVFVFPKMATRTALLDNRGVGYNYELEWEMKNKKKKVKYLIKWDEKRKKMFGWKDNGNKMV